MPDTTEGFFEEQEVQSRLKSNIVSKYFDAWARIRGRCQQLAYVDLFYGPGAYDNGTTCTLRSTRSRYLEAVRRYPRSRRRRRADRRSSGWEVLIAFDLLLVVVHALLIAPRGAAIVVDFPPLVLRHLVLPAQLQNRQQSRHVVRECASIGRGALA